MMEGVIGLFVLWAVVCCVGFGWGLGGWFWLGLVSFLFAVGCLLGVAVLYAFCIQYLLGVYSD
jgi:hypothetical protein